MQTNFLWAGVEYCSLENCLVDTSAAGAEINSTIIGTFDNKIYKTEYCIKTNPGWATFFVEISSRHSNDLKIVRLEGDGEGSWTRGGKIAKQFKGCIDVDISLASFTNSLPINRLNLTENQCKEIQVIYIDVITQQIRPVRQRYTRLSDTFYHYQNVPNDFEAIIEVDEFGFVVDYPPLFRRTAQLRSNYR
jgi:hypothetical protein